MDNDYEKCNPPFIEINLHADFICYVGHDSTDFQFFAIHSQRRSIEGWRLVDRGYR
jgi:hypothetical protein